MGIRLRIAWIESCPTHGLLRIPGISMASHQPAHRWPGVGQKMLLANPPYWLIDRVMAGPCPHRWSFSPCQLACALVPWWFSKQAPVRHSPCQYSLSPKLSFGVSGPGPTQASKQVGYSPGIGSVSRAFGANVPWIRAYDSEAAWATALTGGSGHPDVLSNRHFWAG